ncbi:MAG: hypothetical protein IK024_12360 [Treponema sp.]|nr:hypothetical protein [Treponema sp.]
MEYDKKNARRWSIIGERPTFGTVLHELAKNDNNIMVLVADVTNSAGLGNMQKEMPDRVINVGIAEQNMMGIATGLSSEGYTVFTTTFAPFQSMRCLEQIRVNQGYMKQKVVMVGLAGGVAYGELGFTHCAIEDMSILRSIPNISVVTPADCMEVAKIVEASVDYPESVYIRLMDKTNVPIVYVEDYDFQIGKAVPLIDNGEIAILANGPVVYSSVQAAKRYAEETGFKISVYDFHTVKPVDEELLNKLSNLKALITVEEHSVIGGLGSAVADFYADKKNHPLVYKMGFKDEYPHGASHETLLVDYKLDENGIYEKIRSVIG